eukprot:jgi/Ulvmu1/9448/UM052_0013.1
MRVDYRAAACLQTRRRMVQRGARRGKAHTCVLRAACCAGDTELQSDTGLQFNTLCWLFTKAQRILCSKARLWPGRMFSGPHVFQARDLNLQHGQHGGERSGRGDGAGDCRRECINGSPYPREHAATGSGAGQRCCCAVARQPRRPRLHRACPLLGRTVHNAQRPPAQHVDSRRAAGLQDTCLPTTCAASHWLASQKVKRVQSDAL